ncbi:MAG: hypothetical protein VB027_11330 [Gordonibacter sp.]|nr:hypothetical protein [Gordonibacter sp.]
MPRTKTAVPDEREFSLLRELVNTTYREFKELSKKGPNDVINEYKSKNLERILSPIRTMLENESSYKYLDELSDEALPTNSDVVILLGQYMQAMSKFYGEHYRKTGYSGY